MKADPSEKRRCHAGELMSWTKSLALALVLVFLFLRPFVVQAYHVCSGPMENTLLTGDFLLVDKLAFGGSSLHKIPFTEIDLPCFRIPGYDNPTRGEIIVFDSPDGRAEDYVKRCVAVPGDTVEMRHKILYINHLAQDEPYALHLDSSVRQGANRLYRPGEYGWQYDYLTAGKKKDFGNSYRPTRDNFGPLVVPEGKYFCLGDNRDLSYDSRFWGFVDRETIKGRPVLITYSWNKKSRLPRFERVGRILQ